MAVSIKMNSRQEKEYWSNRYQEGKLGWDIGFPSPPLTTYVDQLTDTSISILIPGAGYAHEAEYFWKKGFNNVFVIDIAELPLKRFQERNPTFPKSQLLQVDFFEHRSHYDLILEQTFFCSLIPTDENRNKYARHMSRLLKPYGKLVGVWFDFPLTDDMEKRPFGGDKLLYLSYLDAFFECKTFNRCYNSILPRQGHELFGIFIRKSNDDIKPSSN